MKRIFIVNPKKDKQLLLQTLNNSNINSFEQEIEFLFLEIGKDLEQENWVLLIVIIMKFEKANIAV